MSSRTWALMPWAVAMNVVAGWLVGLLKLPIYLDSIGTVLAGVLCGPLAGAVTGAVSNGVLALWGNPMFLPFSLTAAAVGTLAGLVARARLFARPQTAAVAGLFTGVVAACISAPISAYVFGGVTGGGTDLVVAYFRSTGRDALQASLSQGLLVDPADKMITFTLVWFILAGLPARLLSSFPGGEALSGLRRRKRRGVARPRGTDTRTARKAPSRTSAGVYRPADGWLHRRAPATKAMLAVGFILAAFLLRASSGGHLIPTLPLLAAALFGLALFSGIGPEMARSLAVFWGPLAISVTAVNAWFGAGLLVGVITALRVAVVLEAALAVLMTTRPRHLAWAAERVGLSPRISYVVLSTLSLLPVAAQRFQEIQDAQASRGLAFGGSALARIRAVLPLLGPVMMGALAEVEQRAMALEARGFGVTRRRTSLEDPPGARDLPLQLLLLLGLTALVVLR